MSGCSKPASDAQQRRLAAAAGAEQGEELALADLERDVVHGPQGAEALARRPRNSRCSLNPRDPRPRRASWWLRKIDSLSDNPPAFSRISIYAITTADQNAMNPVEIAVSLFVLLFAITVHEASHGWAAKRMGDTTAYDLGRVTPQPAGPHRPGRDGAAAPDAGPGRRPGLRLGQAGSRQPQSPAQPAPRQLWSSPRPGRRPTSWPPSPP